MNSTTLLIRADHSTLTSLEVQSNMFQSNTRSWVGRLRRPRRIVHYKRLVGGKVPPLSARQVWYLSAAHSNSSLQLGTNLETPLPEDLEPTAKVAFYISALFEVCLPSQSLRLPVNVTRSNHSLFTAETCAGTHFSLADILVLAGTAGAGRMV